SLKTSIKTITYLSDIGCLEIQGASLVLDTEVRIERIVHGSRDINRVLAEPDDKPSDHFWQL
ncbi:hypothetical protein V5054_13070, partial [Escherichia coli]